jgi:hypothetical protein
LSSAISCEVNKSAVIPVDAWILISNWRIGTGTTASTWDGNRPANQKFTQREDGILELAMNQAATGNNSWLIFYVDIPAGYPNPGNTYWQPQTNNNAPNMTGTWVTPGRFNAAEQGTMSWQVNVQTGGRQGKFEINPTTRQWRFVPN